MTADWRATLHRTVWVLEDAEHWHAGREKRVGLEALALLHGLLDEPQVNPSEAKELQLREAAKRFRAALAPGYIVWHTGTRLSPDDTLTQIERGLLAAGLLAEGEESRKP